MTASSVAGTAVYEPPELWPIAVFCAHRPAVAPTVVGSERVRRATPWAGVAVGRAAQQVAHDAVLQRGGRVDRELGRGGGAAHRAPHGPALLAVHRQRQGGLGLDRVAGRGQQVGADGGDRPQFEPAAVTPPKPLPSAGIGPVSGSPCAATGSGWPSGSGWASEPGSAWPTRPGSGWPRGLGVGVGTVTAPAAVNSA